MRHHALAVPLFSAALVLPIAPEAHAAEQQEPQDQQQLLQETAGGLTLKTADDAVVFKLDGRLQLDYDRFDGLFTNNGKTADEAYVRRAYSGLSGTVYSDWDYRLELDFAESGEARQHELSISYKGFDPISLRAGRFDMDIGLEEATSSKWLTTIERALIYDFIDWAHTEEDNLGLEVQGTALDMLYLSAGIFRQQRRETIGNQERQVAEDENGKGKNSYALRAVLLPLHDVRQLLHLGVSYAHRGVAQTTGEITSSLTVRGAAEDALNGADVTLAPAALFERDRAWMLEAAYRFAALSVQGEYLQRRLAGAQGVPDRQADGYYLQLAYSLTGEARRYELDRAAFGAIKPASHIGAWELFYRFQDTTLENVAADSEVRIHTLGLNWYANEAIKVALNYVRADSANLLSGDALAAGQTTQGDAISTRLQFVF